MISQNLIHVMYHFEKDYKKKFIIFKENRLFRYFREELRENNFHNYYEMSVFFSVLFNILQVITKKEKGGEILK